MGASDQRMPRTTPYIALSQGQCATCGAACRWQCGRCGCDVFCFKIVAVLGMHFCDPNQLIATKQRNKLAAANKALCYLTRIVQRGPAYTGFSDTRLFELV